MVSQSPEVILILFDGSKCVIILVVNIMNLDLELLPFQVAPGSPCYAPIITMLSIAGLRIYLLNLTKKPTQQAFTAYSVDF